MFQRLQMARNLLPVKNNADQSSDAKAKGLEQYNDLTELVDAIESHVIDTENIPLNSFQDSGAYQGASKQFQDCINIAGKIREKLGDQEIVHCSENSNYYEDIAI